MIWYLLYPFRGTTEPPDLARSHPLRRTLARYGRYVAGHVVTALLISAAVATILVYPIPYIFTRDFVNGASYMPHHVWTVAQALPHDAAIHPDIVMRSIWVHASYMEALKSDVLVSALDLQNELLGETRNFSPMDLSPDEGEDQVDGFLTLAQRNAAHISNGLTAQSWFFHSPLIYWQYSRDAILADPDILSTINNKRNQSNFANTTLRHSVVFSGKRFEDRRLVAADAIVVTLLHLKDSPMGSEWERKAATLPQKFSDRFDIYPPDGRSVASHLYEFQFRPISIQDILSLAFAYSLALLYFLMSLSKLRAVKSRVGLIITIIAQIAFSIMSSFTVCAIFNFNLSRIPHAAYPLVVLSMSLENILRLINAVILTPVEDSTSIRIGHAFGQTAHTALTSSMQNVLILIGLSRLVSPGVSAFCVFAAVAIIFDFFYLSTFFLSVLSVDVRRMELGDALAKVALRQSRQKQNRLRHTSRIDVFFQRKIAWSTRIAGTVIMMGFVLIAQWHFFGDDSISLNILKIFRVVDDSQGPRNPETTFLKGLHQARSHASWIRNQDHETAQEVIRLIKPSAHSYVAKVFDPLVFVKTNSDRIPHSKEPTFLPAAYDFVHHQSSRFIVIVVVIVAALRLLMNYLLWGEDAELEDDGDLDHNPILAIRSLRGGHVLDVALLSRSTSGHIVSVGLDRVVRVWDIRGSGSSYVVRGGEDHELCPFPILHMAIDDTSTWLALLSTSRVSFWNLRHRVWGGSVHLETAAQRPAAFFFNPALEVGVPEIVVVHHNGTIVELTAGKPDDTVITSVFGEQVVMARHLIRKRRALIRTAVVIITKQGAIHVAEKQQSRWELRRIDLQLPDPHGACHFVPMQPIGILALATTSCVSFIDPDQGNVLRSFKTEPMVAKTLQCAILMSDPANADCSSLISLTLSYCASETGECILQTYVPADDQDVIDMQQAKENLGDCGSEKSIRELKKRIKNPGAWNLLADGSLVGIRQVAQRNNPTNHPTPGLRRRGGTQRREQYSFANWEVWACSSCTQSDMEESRSLFDQGDESGHLVVSDLGPRVTVGSRSVAFAFGNVIKLVTTGGQERYGADSERPNGDSLRKTTSRRRKAGPGGRARAAS